MKRRGQERRTNAYASLNIDEVYCWRTGENDDRALLLLAASIARHGLLQPIVVRHEEKTGRYVLICGARRLKACAIAGLGRVDAIVLGCDAAEAVACRMEEHWTARSPGIIEEAEQIEHAGAESVKTRFALPLEMLDNRLLMRMLSEPVRREISAHSLTLEQVLPILRIDSEAGQLEAISIIAQRGLTGAQCRRLVSGPQIKKEQSVRCSGRRRAVSAVMEAVSEAVGKLQAKGMPIQLAMHAQESGVTIQIVLKKDGVNEVTAGKRGTDGET